MDILLLRHAPTESTERRRRQGWADEPLTPAARSAARTWSRRAPWPLDAVVSSDLQRASETGRIIADALSLGSIEQLWGLREQDQGEWTGLTKPEIRARWPERSGEHLRSPVGGEPPEALLERVLSALGWVADVHAGGRVLAVTHSGVIRMLERAIGADARPVPCLEGRWVRVTAAGARGLAVDGGSATDGRLDGRRSRPEEA